MWEATGPDGQRIWLLGTIHSLPDGLEWRTPAIEQVIADTDVLLVEIANLGARQEAGEAFETRAYDTELAPLLDRVPQERRATLATSLDRAGLDAEALIHTDTWAVALQLGNAIRCANPANGVDRALLRELDDARSLESYGQQFGAFDGLPDHAQIDLLLSVAEEQDCSASEARTEAWLTGDIATLETRILAGFRGNVVLKAALVDARNAHYVDQIVEYRALDTDADLLVAVGAGHMLGDTGLPALLTARGYKVRRIQ
ncbi:TraB/GumN family protein [Erythrobacter alti]|uniref:TraB/GumN family protein n=1 Tax=Erythrobacter alti TaxID=1896145 RepID=UPI0030F3EC06